MVEFFCTIGFLVVTGFCLVSLLKLFISQREYRHHLIELYYGQPYNHCIEYPYSEIKKFFKENPEELKRREEKWQEKQRKKYEEKELERKEKIKDRIFAYDYEDTLFRIFAPMAEFKGGVWYCDMFNSSLPKEDIVAKISQYRNVSPEEADIIFEGLIKHNILFEFGGKYSLHLINSIRDWDVVSDIDMNLDKWMKENGYGNK